MSDYQKLRYFYMTATLLILCILHKTLKNILLSICCSLNIQNNEIVLISYSSQYVIREK